MCNPLRLLRLIAILALAGLSRYALAQTAKPVDFTRDIRPLLKAHCDQCHAGAAAEGGLRMDTAALFRKGGAGGPIVVAGKPGVSPLIARLTGVGGKPTMPLGFAPLPPTNRRRHTGPTSRRSAPNSPPSRTVPGFRTRSTPSSAPAWSAKDCVRRRPPTASP